jgi:hypothetical protein
MVGYFESPRRQFQLPTGPNQHADKPECRRNHIIGLSRGKGKLR